VYFGTFNGVSDSVTTPASGELTIKGDYVAFGVGAYKTYNSSSSKTINNRCACITAVVEFGTPTKIPGYAFAECSGLTNIDIPDSVTSIETYAVSLCPYLASIKLPNSVTTLEPSIISGSSALTSLTIPASVTTIKAKAINSCPNLTSVTFENTTGWYITQTEGGDVSTGRTWAATDPQANASYLLETRSPWYFYRT
jgi:hypothetical protein